MNEQTPLLSDSGNSHDGAQLTNSQTYDRVKREEVLNDIVQYTGENLIDVTSISQPEVRTVGKSANEYKKILAELKYANSGGTSSSVSTSPNSTNASSSVNNHSLNKSLLPKTSTNSLISDTEKKWLDGIASEATKALKDEPIVHPVGTLVLNFQE